MLDFLLYALEVLDWAVVFITVAVAFVLIFWPDREKQ